MADSIAAYPPGLENEDRGPALRIFIIVLMAVCAACVLVRFWSRSLNRAESRGAIKFWWDDWLALAALPFVLATGALALDMIRLGLGKHIWVVPPQNLVPALTRLYAIYFLYDTALLLAKASCLLFYARVFGRPLIDGWFKWALWVTHGINFAWFIGIVFGTIFMCNPVAKNWNPMLEGKCGTANSLWLGSAIPSVAIDFILLVLPLPRIWRLQMSIGHKMAILVIFIVGYSVIVVSLGRLITIIKSEEAMNRDLTYEGIPGIYWQAAEGPITLISVCLPGMLNIGRRIVKGRISHILSAMSSKISQISLLRSMRSKNGSQGSPEISNLENASKASCESEDIMLHPGEASKTYITSAHGDDYHGYHHQDKDSHGSIIRIQKDVSVSRNDVEKV